MEKSDGFLVFGTPWWIPLIFLATAIQIYLNYVANKRQRTQEKVITSAESEVRDMVNKHWTEVMKKINHSVTLHEIAWREMSSLLLEQLERIEIEIKDMKARLDFLDGIEPEHM